MATMESTSEHPASAPRRWPRSVYGVGTEPDPRFSLANERTFLAWIRTTLAMLAAAAAVNVLDLSMPESVQRATAGLLAFVSLACAIQAWRGWARTERAMRQNLPLPSSPTNLPLAIGVGLVAIAIIAITLIG